MTREEFSRPSSEAAPLADVVHRRWLLSKRVDDGRPLLVREDRVVNPSGCVGRPRRSAAHLIRAKPSMASRRAAHVAARPCLPSRGSSSGTIPFRAPDMRHMDPSEPGEASRLKGSLDGPSKTIIVEPVQVPAPPVPRRVEPPDPARRPDRPREPERPREPAR